MRALDDLTRQGLVRYVGVSNWSAGRLGKSLGLSEALKATRFETLQAYYSIAGRDVERELVPLVREEKMGLLVWSPLAGGLLSGKFSPGAAAESDARRNKFDFPPVDRDLAWKCLDAMRAIADKRAVSVSRIALAWLLAKPDVTSVIIGVKRLAQLRDNLLATDIILTAEELAHLDAISSMPPHYPAWMIEVQDAERYPKSFTAKIPN